MILPQARDLVALLTAQGVLFEEGLTESEFAQLADHFSVVFPPDLYRLLHVALPVSPTFAPWRRALASAAGADELRYSLSWPLEGLIFDAQVNMFWYPEWGTPPPTKTAKSRSSGSSTRATRP